MAFVIIAIWMGLLALLVKFGVFRKWALWMKISPIVIYLIYFIIVAIPMGFQAPKGAAIVLRESAPISPAVPGTVTSVSARPGEVVQAGDVLFALDPAQYLATVTSLEADIALINTRLEQARELVARGAGRVADEQKYQSELAGLNARLNGARWNLEQTQVRAPRTGIIPAVMLEEGTQVSPGMPVMTVIETDRSALVVRIAQNYLRHIQPGQKAEVVFKLFPGRVIPATVKQIAIVNPGGQVGPSSQMIDTQEWSEQPFLVELDISPDASLPELPAGAFGTVAIYTTGLTSISELIRAVMLRTETWLNFL